MFRFGHGHGLNHHNQRSYNIQANQPPHNINDETFWGMEQLQYKISTAQEEIDNYEKQLDGTLQSVKDWIQRQKQDFRQEMETRLARWNGLVATRVQFEQRKVENKLNIQYSDPDSPWRVLLDGRDIFSIIFQFLSARELLGRVQLTCWDFLNIIQECVPLCVNLSTNQVSRFPMDAILLKYHLRSVSVSETGGTYTYGGGLWSSSSDKLLTFVKNILKRSDKLEGFTFAISSRTLMNGNHASSDSASTQETILSTLKDKSCAKTLKELDLCIGIPDGLSNFQQLSSLSVSCPETVPTARAGLFGNPNPPQVDIQKIEETRKRRFQEFVDWVASSKTLTKLAIRHLKREGKDWEQLVQSIRSNHNLKHLTFGSQKSNSTYYGIHHNNAANADETNTGLEEFVNYLCSDFCSIESMEFNDQPKSQHYYRYRNRFNSASVDSTLEKICESYNLLSSLKKIVVDVTTMDCIYWNLLGIDNCDVEIRSDFTQGKAVSQFLNMLDPTDASVNRFRFNEFQLILTSSKTAAEKFIGSNSAIKHLSLGCVRAKYDKSYAYMLKELSNNDHLETLTIYSNLVSSNSVALLNNVANLLHSGHPSLKALRFELQDGSEQNAIHAQNNYYYMRRKHVSHDRPHDQSEDPALITLVGEIEDLLKDDACEIETLYLVGLSHNGNERFRRAILIRKGLLSEEDEEEDAEMKDVSVEDEKKSGQTQSKKRKKGVEGKGKASKRRRRV